MKEKSNATLRRAASLRCRTDAAIARLGRAVACYQRGAITTAELLREASAAADRAGTLELSAAELAATGSFGRSVNRKVKACLLYTSGSPYKGAASCFHPRKAHDHRDGERYDQLLSRASAHRFSGIRRTADAGRETPSALFANVSRTLGPLRRRECRHGSILFGDLRSKSPSRRDWDSRDNGRGAWVFWAFIISLSWSQQQ